MKHIIATLFVALAAVGQALALAPDPIGLCKNTILSSGITSHAGTYQVAVKLTSKQLSGFDDYALSALEVGFYDASLLGASRAMILSDTAAVRDTLAIGDVVTFDTAPQDWQRIAFRESLPLAGVTTPLYLVYEFEQTAQGTFPLGTSGTKGTAGSFMMNDGSGFADVSKQYRPLCLRGVLGATVPDAVVLFDAGLDTRSVALDAATGLPTDSIRLRGAVLNMGSNPLTSFSLSVCTAEGHQPTVVTYQCEPVEYNDFVDFHFAFLPDAQLGIDRTLSFDVMLPNGKENAADADPTHGQLYYEVSRQGRHHEAPLLVEEFTSTLNGYAPCGTHHLREALDEVFPRGTQGEANTHYVCLSRHEGYGPADAYRYTTYSDYSAEWFGPKTLTFAPAAWLHRQDVPLSTTLPTDSLVALIRHYDAQRPAATFAVEVSDVRLNTLTNSLSATVSVGGDAVSLLADPRVFAVVCADTLAGVTPRNYFPEAYPTTQLYHTVLAYLTDSAAPSAGGTSLFGQADAVEARSITYGRKPAASYFSTRAGSDLYWHDMSLTATLPTALRPYAGRSLTVVAYLVDAATGQVYGATLHTVRL